MEDELLLDSREPIHISLISVNSENNKLTVFVNCVFLGGADRTPVGRRFQ
jgi:hypothetical protein